MKPRLFPDAVRHGALGRCPRCGEGRLFASLTGFALRCDQCGLDFASFNVGDGPAAFLTLIIGAVTVLLALWVELSFAPPVWVHVLLWTPLVAAGTLASLRVAKGALLAQEFRHQAAEGRLADLAPLEDETNRDQDA